MVLWCFQGVDKGCIRNKWVNRVSNQRRHFPKHDAEYKTIIRLNILRFFADN